VSLQKVNATSTKNCITKGTAKLVDTTVIPQRAFGRCWTSTTCRLLIVRRSRLGVRLCRRIRRKGCAAWLGGSRGGSGSGSGRGCCCCCCCGGGGGGGGGIRRNNRALAAERREQIRRVVVVLLFGRGLAWLLWLVVRLWLLFVIGGIESTEE